MVNSYNLSDQMATYRQLMDRLICEKSDAKQLAQKQIKAQQTANEIFFIQGDPFFREQMRNYLGEIAKAKPGRQLIKALKQMGSEITIQPGKSCELVGSTVFMTDQETRDYNAIDAQGVKITATSPSWVSLAHELIHALHANDLKIACDIRSDILEGMDNLEEQHAICGFNHTVFLDGKITKAAFLCENAFLLAMGLPPRIDHGSASSPLQVKHSQARVPLENYYNWLEAELAATREIPSAKMQDEEFILHFVKRNPLSLSTISPALKTEEFFLRVIMRHAELIASIPAEYYNDKVFMLKVVQLKPMALFEVDSELFHDKDFAASVLKILSPRLKKAFLSHLDAALQSDPDIACLQS